MRLAPPLESNTCFLKNLLIFLGHFYWIDLSSNYLYILSIKEIPLENSKMPLPKVVTPVHFLGFSVFQPFHFPLPCLLHVSDFPYCACAPVCFFTWLIKISSILSVMLQFGFFVFHLSRYRRGLGSLSVLFSCMFSYMHVSFSFFCVGRGLASLLVLFSCIFSYIHVALCFSEIACQLIVFVSSCYFCCYVLVLFSCVFSYMHVSFSFFCVGQGLASLLAYRVSLFLVLLLFHFFPVL